MDTNFRSIADVDGYSITNERIDPELDGLRAGDFDDILKLSHARNFVGSELYVVGGRENSVDMNRYCRNVRLEDCKLVAGRKCAVVIKGGCEDISLSRVVISDAVGSYDIELGGWSDQSNNKTRRVTLTDVTRSDGKAVRVVVGRAERPTIIGGNVKILTGSSLALKAFWAAKYLFRRLTKRS